MYFSPHLRMCLLILEREEKRERKKNINVREKYHLVAFYMCPDWESNRRPFGSHAQSTELHQPGLFVFYLCNFCVCLYLFLSCLWVICSCLFVCLVIFNWILGILNFTLLDAAYFDISLNFFFCLLEDEVN